MSVQPLLDGLETDRLILRRRSVDEAAIYRRLWLERDLRVPAHRRIDAEGRPTVELLAAAISKELEDPRPALLAVVRTGTGDVIGYCGLVFHGNGAPDEPELAHELLRRAHGSGCATEAGAAVVAWAAEAGYERVWATVRAWNVASRRVLEKLGVPRDRARRYPAERAAMARQPWLQKPMLGQPVHRSTADALEEAYPGRFVYRTRGPDFLDNTAGELLELMTPGQVGAHLARSGCGGVTMCTYTLRAC